MQVGADFSKEWDASDKYSNMEKLFSKELKTFTFWVSWVPVVVTNRLTVDMTLKGEIEGNVGLSYSEEEEREVGVEFNSKIGKIEEINKTENDTDGLKWTSLGISGEFNSGVQVHLKSLLYGATGLDGSVGIEGNIEGEAELYVSAEKNEQGLDLEGELEVYIGPMLRGKLVVEVPIVHKKLVEQELFYIEFLPFWKDEWKYPEDDASESESEKIVENTEETKSMDNTQNTEDTTNTVEYNKIYNNTYIMPQKAYVVTCPVFNMDYPDNWSITQENEENGLEWNIIENTRGVTINYVECSPAYASTLGAGTKQINTARITKVADSAFVPGRMSGTDKDSDLGKFMVAKVKTFQYEDQLTGEGPVEFDGPTMYAVMPESYEGKEIVYTGLGYITEIAWDYPAPLAVFADSPNGVFSSEEEAEVINILSSFRAGKAPV